MAKKDPTEEIPHQRAGPRPDFSEPVPSKKLPAALQKTLDNEEQLWETMYDTKYVPSEALEPGEAVYHQHRS
jgi:mitochondrial fission process protein 1